MGRVKCAAVSVVVRGSWLTHSYVGLTVSMGERSGLRPSVGFKGRAALEPPSVALEGESVDRRADPNNLYTTDYNRISDRPTVIHRYKQIQTDTNTDTNIH